MATASSIAAQIAKNRIFQGFYSKKWDFPERQKRVALENPVFCDKSLSGTATPESITFYGTVDFNIFNISPERNTFSQKSASFRGNVEYVESWGGMLNQNVLTTAEMLNMLNMLNVFGRARRKGGFGQVLPKTFNIFNISPERDTFSQKSASFRGNVEYVEFSGAC